MADPEKEAKLLVAKRNRLTQNLQETYDLISKLPENEDIFLARADNLDEKYDSFETLQDDLARVKLETNDQTIAISSATSAYELLYFEVVAKARSINQARRSAEAATANATNHANGRQGHEVKTLRPKLPPIEIPKFKGDIERFPTFKSLFDTLVHNTDLSPIQKFSFLKTYLEYPALGVIEHFDFVEENYDAAYLKLVQRYTDRRMVGTHFLTKLFQFKPLTHSTSNNLQQFVDQFCVYYESLKALRIPDLTDFIVFNLAMKVLDPDTKRLFEEKHAQEEFPSFEVLSSFVQNQCKVASLVQAPSSRASGPSYAHGHVPSNPKSGSYKKVTIPTTKSFVTKVESSLNPTGTIKKAENQAVSKVKCPVCDSQHRIMACPSFLSLSPIQRLEKAQASQLCFACLGPHPRTKCQTKFRCKVCNQKGHHTLLHRDLFAPNMGELEGRGNNNNHSPEVTGSEHKSTNVLNCYTQAPPTKPKSTLGLLGTARARIRSRSGDWITVRLVIDPASESSFITDSLVQSLGLPRRKSTVDVMGVGSSKFLTNRGCITFDMCSSQAPTPVLSVDAVILASITSLLPKVPLKPEIRNRFSKLCLADPKFDKPGPIDILFGVQHYSEILPSKPIHISGEPAALSSIFGFVIFGKIPAETQIPSSVSLFTHTSPLDEVLRQFWELEEVSPTNVMTASKDYCETHFCENTVRDSSGRYQVSLPFRDGKVPENLGSTRDIAHKRLYSLEKKLERNPIVKELYHANLQGYIAENHMEPANNNVEYLLTHHGVVKESTTTQLRVVFNASEKSTTKHSLNEYLLPGPKLQTDISQILLKFRLNPVALCADIRQMYRNIRLHPVDRQFAHVLWRTDPNQSVTEWEMTTLPFGFSCSPFLAQRVVQQLVEDEGHRFPQAAKMAQSQLYVDDLVCAVASENEAIALYHELTELFNRGCFVLRKFASNNQTVLANIPADCCQTSVDFGTTTYVKLLGFLWNPATDMFSYKISLDTCICTKRGILSQVARIYDINGYVSPITFWIKYFIQRLWLSGVEWDQELPVSLKEAWVKFYTQLPILGNIEIPRVIGCHEAVMITIVGFCDASEKGFASCLYVRCHTKEHTVQVRLLKAKSKVAPLKPVTIPRLELNGALLLAKLVDSIQEFLSSLVSYEIVCFTDSTTVLSWLRTPPHLLKTYVANRVVQILDVLPPSLWRHVPGELNAADIASRGTYPEQFMSHELWWTGPTFLCDPIVDWPIKEYSVVDPIPEIKSQMIALVSQEDPRSSLSLTEIMLKNKSSLKSVQRIVGYILRFASNCRVEVQQRERGPLTHTEMEQAVAVLVRCSQARHFGALMNRLENNLPAQGTLRHLTPFLSEEGLIKVGGRLTFAPLSDDQKHPFLLDRRSRLATLVASYYHELTLHGGPQLMQSIIQTRFWIPGIRYLLRSIVFNCVKCYRFKAKSLEPFMSPIPRIRFQQGRAFVHTGVDLAGPLLLKESRRRNAQSHKCWVVVFICLSTRAVYIDLVSSLSSIAFLATLDRFIARRGIPAQVFSDLGTNFVGAARELKEVFNELIRQDERFASYCSERKITWNFNPPAAPNFGGSWEAAVKSMKFHLKRVVADRPLTFEEHSTLLAKIEAILNSRPLCPLPSQPTDGFEYLTPGHFLVGAPVLLSRPELDHLDVRLSVPARWKAITKAAQEFWQRWSQEYLGTLIQRPKWDQRQINLAPGDMVVILEKNLPPTAWALARVMEVFPGQDQVVRTVKLRTPTGVLTRPANKLAVLPFSAMDHEDREE